MASAGLEAEAENMTSLPAARSDAGNPLVGMTPHAMAAWLIKEVSSGFVTSM